MGRSGNSRQKVKESLLGRSGNARQKGREILVRRAGKFSSERLRNPCQKDRKGWSGRTRPASKDTRLLGRDTGRMAVPKPPYCGAEPEKISFRRSLSADGSGRFLDNSSGLPSSMRRQSSVSSSSCLCGLYRSAITYGLSVTTQGRSIPVFLLERHCSDKNCPGRMPESFPRYRKGC